MTYIRHIPSPPLNTYIDYLSFLDGPMPYPRAKVLPFPALDLKINFGGALIAYEPNRTEPIASCAESWWMGLWSTYHAVDWPLDMQLFCVIFKPAGAYPFLQLPLSELHNQVVSADAIWGHGVAEIRERLYAAPTIQARFALLERLLLARLDEVPYGLKTVRYAVAEIARQHGALSIRTLSDDLGSSQAHLITLFKRMVGVSPKELARFYRLKHVLRSIDPTQPIDWAQIAHQAHYYDQSHFNKDFVAFTGHNPTEYLQLRRQIHTTDPEHKQILRLLPIV
jgi:AraC-like DNA-binding protein